MAVTSPTLALILDHAQERRDVDRGAPRQQGVRLAPAAVVRQTSRLRRRGRRAARAGRISSAWPPRWRCWRSSAMLGPCCGGFDVSPLLGRCTIRLFRGGGSWLGTPDRSDVEREPHRQPEIVALRNVAVGIRLGLLDAVPGERHVEIERTPDLDRQHRFEMLAGIAGPSAGDA